MSTEAAQPSVRGLFVAAFLIFAPLSAPIYASVRKISNATLDQLPSIAIIACASAVATLSLAAVWARKERSSFQGHKTSRAIGWCIGLAFFDVTIFGLVAYGRSLSTQECLLGAECSRYPLTLLALAAMHLIHAAAIGILKRGGE